MTFGTYFNAFPASYWRRWTDHAHRPAGRARSPARARVIVYRSTAKGHVQRADSAIVDVTRAGRPSRSTSPLKPFIDGGWYWFDLEAGDRADAPARRRSGPSRPTSTQSGTVSIGITTFNRPDFCVDQLHQARPGA